LSSGSAQFTPWKLLGTAADELAAEEDVAALELVALPLEGAADEAKALVVDTAASRPAETTSAADLRHVNSFTMTAPLIRA
jgi:hypothetical protein